MNFLESTKNKATKIFKKLLEKHNLPLSFLENSLFQRWAIAVILCLILAIILAPEIHLSAPEFKQGMIAPKNIKADHSFLVEDQQATELKKNDTGDTNPVFFQVQKNEMIVREGEKIGYLELAKLNAFFKSAEDNKIFQIYNLSGIFLHITFSFYCFVSLGAQETGLKLPPAPTLTCLFSALLPFYKYYLSKRESSFLSPSTEHFRPYQLTPVILPYPSRWEQ